VVEFVKSPSLFLDQGDNDLEIEALYERAFGPGRHAKAAARLREGNHYLPTCSVFARLDHSIVGACRLWRVLGENGVSALFLGPIAVDQAHRSFGLGRALLNECLAQAGHSEVVILVGDLAYFAASGFEIIPNGQIIMPGPVDPKRLLWRIGIVDQGNLPNGRLSVPHATNQTD
jgi:predicted N-acetyltransferase YhbS